MSCLDDSCTFVSLTEADLPLMLTWFALPHVAAWWHESNDLNFVAAKYRSKLSGGKRDQFLIWIAGRPVGYIQWNDAAEDPLWNGLYQAGTYGVDVLIGDPNFVGKGYGPRVLVQFIKEHLLPLNPQKIIVDPEIENIRAIRCYEKVGFVKTQEWDEPFDDGRVVKVQLMELNPCEMDVFRAQHETAHSLCHQ